MKDTPLKNDFERRFLWSSNRRFADRLGYILIENAPEARSMRRKRYSMFFNCFDKISYTCVAGKKALKFRLDIHKAVKYNQIKDKLIGRVLPPYITQIQQSCANHITREGIMPTPKEIFEKINL